MDPPLPLVIFLSTFFLFRTSIAQVGRPLYQCDFETSEIRGNVICGSIQPNTDDMDWTVGSGSTPSDDTGPSSAISGRSYLYTEASNRRAGERARFMTTGLPPGVKCVRFQRHMYGQHIGKLRVIGLVSNRETVYGEFTKDHTVNGNSNWVSTAVTVQAGDTVVIEAVKGGQSSDEPYGDIAIDNMVITDGSCSGIAGGGSPPPPTTTTTTTTTKATTRSTAPSTTKSTVPSQPTGNTLLYQCDFESPEIRGDVICGSVQPQNDDMDWTVGSGSTPSDDTGPRSAFRGRNYIFTEVSGKNPGVVAQFVTTHLSPGVKCLRFQRNMYGQHIGKLRVIGLVSGNRNVYAEYKKEGDIGNGNPEWVSTVLTIPAGEQVMFEAVKGGIASDEPFGDIAMDNITITSGSCSGNAGVATPPVQTTTTPSTSTKTSSTTSKGTAPIRTTTSTRTTTPATPSTTDASQSQSSKPLYQCDFEDPEIIGDTTCGSVQPKNDDMDWTVGSGSTPSDDTGPRSAFSGHNYIFTEGSGKNPGDVARFLTTVLSPGVKCLRFQRNMYGQHIGKLRVIGLVSGNRNVYAEYKKEGDIGNGNPEWVSTVLTIPAGEQVMFEAVKGGIASGEPFGDIAMDNITITSGSCSGNAGVATSTKGDGTPRKETTPATTTKTSSTTSKGTAPIRTPTSTRTTTPATPSTTDASQSQSSKPLYQCDFEDPEISRNAFCGSVQPQNDDMDWTVGSGSTPSDDTGPRSAFSGHNYIFTEGSGKSPGDVARFLTTALSPGVKCLRFQRNMYGQHIGKLTVIGLVSGNRNVYAEYKKEGDIGNGNPEWVSTVLTIQAGEQVMFEAVKGGIASDEPFGDIAMDNITITSGSCSGNTGVSTTSRSTSKSSSTTSTTTASTPSSTTTPTTRSPSTASPSSTTSTTAKPTTTTARVTHTASTRSTNPATATPITSTVSTTSRSTSKSSSTASRTTASTSSSTTTPTTGRPSTALPSSTTTTTATPTTTTARVTHTASTRSSNPATVKPITSTVCDAVRISGASNLQAKLLNGVYRRDTKKSCSGRPVWTMKSDAGLFMRVTREPIKFLYVYYYEYNNTIGWRIGRESCAPRDFAFGEASATPLDTVQWTEVDGVYVNGVQGKVKSNIKTECVECNKIRISDASARQARLLNGVYTRDRQKSCAGRPVWTMRSTAGVFMAGTREPIDFLHIYYNNTEGWRIGRQVCYPRVFAYGEKTLTPMDTVQWMEVDGKYVNGVQGKIRTNLKAVAIEYVAINISTQMTTEPAQSIWSSFLPNSTQINLSSQDNCNASLTVDWCTVDLSAQPVGCLTFGNLLSTVIGIPFNDLLEDAGNHNPASWKLQKAFVDNCADSFVMEVKIPYEFDIIPDLLQLDQPIFYLDYHFPTEEYEMRFSSTIKFGKNHYYVELIKTHVSLELWGEASDSTINIGNLLVGMSSSFVSGNSIESIINQAGLNNLVLSNIMLHVLSSDAGIGVDIDFRAELGQRAGDYTIKLDKQTSNCGSARAGVVLIGRVEQIKPVDFILDLTGIDLTQIPVISDFTVPNLVIIVSSKDIQNPVIPLALSAFPEVTSISKGICLIFSISFGGSANPVTFIINIDGSKPVRFTIPSRIPVEDLLNDFLDSAFQVSLPQWFTLDEFLAQSIDTFVYDVATKVIHMDIALPQKIYLIDEGLVLSDSTLSVQVSLARTQTSKFGIHLQSFWAVRDIDIALSIEKEVGSGNWIAEGRPDADIPVGALIEKFALSIIPPGPLRDGFRNVGFDAFLIVDPMVKVFIGSSAAAKVSGTAEFEEWGAAATEMIIAKKDGATIMGMGMVMQKISLPKIIRGVTNGALDLAILPGATLLEHINVALVFASEFIPRGTKHISFDSPLLSEMDILDGLAVAASFSIPSDCGNDKFCLVLQNVLGVGTGLVLKGAVNLPNIHIQALLPGNLNIMGGVIITDVGFEVSVGTRSSIGITGKLVLSEPTSIFPDPIVLIGGLGASTSGGYLKMSMAGMWKRAFGLPWVSIGNLNLLVAVVPDPIVLSVLELGGEAIIGNTDDPRVEPVHVSLYVGIDRITPSQSYFSGSINRLTLPAIVKAFDPTVSLPKALDEIGYPEGLNCSFAMASRILPNGVVIPRGFYYRGMLQILDFKAWSEMRVSLNGVFANITANPFEMANGLVSLKGLSPGKGPRLFVNINWNPPVAEIQIEAKVTVLAITASINLTIDHRGMYFEITGKVLGIAEASLKLQAQYSSVKDLAFMVEGSFKQNFVQTVKNNVIESLNTYKENADREISAAQQDVENERRKFEDAQRKLANARSDVDSKQVDFDRAVASIDRARDKLEKEKRKFESASNEVNRARQVLNDKRRNLDNAQEDLRRKRADVDKKQRDFDAAIMNLENKKAEIRRKQAQWDAKSREYQRKIDSCPSGWGIRDACVAGYKALSWAVGAAASSLEVAKKSLGALQHIVDNTRFSLDVAKAPFFIAQAGVEAARGGLTVAEKTLEGLEIVVREAKVLVDAAQLGLTLASEVADRSRGFLNVAKVVLSGAEELVKGSQGFLDVAIGFLDGVKVLNEFGTKIGAAIVKGLFPIDIREITFRASLSAANSGSFEVSIRVSFFGLPEINPRLHIDLSFITNFIGALIEMAKKAILNIG